MRAFRVSPTKTSGKSIRTAVAVLEAGGIVAFPTETVYGLCVDPRQERAVARLYEVKGRDAEKACAYLLANPRQAHELAGDLPPPAQRLADAYWPGPLTLVVPAPGGGKVGLRYPAVPIARALARAVGHPLLQTSANRSGEPAALNAAGIAKTLAGGVDLVLDAGRVSGGVASTVVECAGPRFHILREGALTTAEIEEAAVERLLLVCTGNICRSPLAEVALRDRLAAKLGLAPAELARHAFHLSSCGIAGWVDSPATKEMIRASKPLGYDLRPHRGRLCTPALLGQSHRVWVMTRAQYDELKNHFQDRPEALQLFDPAGADVDDPFQRPGRVYREIARAIDRIAETRVGELVPGVA